jgi:hypothetical protein
MQVHVYARDREARAGLTSIGFSIDTDLANSLDSDFGDGATPVELPLVFKPNGRYLVTEMVPFTGYDDYFAGGGNAPSHGAGGGPLGGDNAALALFGIFVTVVAAGFSSAKL